MFIFKIFSIKKTINEAREGLANPGGFAVKQVGDVIRFYLILSLLAVFLILTLLFIFGFTDWLGGGFKIARILFWVFLFLVLASLLVLGPIFFKIRKIFKKLKQNSNQNDLVKIKIDEVK